MLESIYSDKTNALLSDLEKVLNSDFYTYEMTKEIKSCGVYIVYRENKIIYVGKTTRTINERLRELGNGGHTLNKKLLQNLLRKTLKMPNLKLGKKKKLIQDKILTEEILKKCRKEIKDELRSNCKYKFCEIEHVRLSEVEHFFIAILNPEYND